MNQGLSNQGRARESQYLEILIHCSRYETRPVNIETVLREIHIDTNYNLNSISTNLSNLDIYAATVGHDITNINEHVKN